MGRFLKRESHKAGLPPGTLVHIGEKKIDTPVITVMHYDEQGVEETKVSSAAECARFRERSPVTWINIDGIHDVSLIEQIGKDFDIHPLVLEDVVNTTQRPKADDAERYIFVCLKMLRLSQSQSEVQAEHVSLILAPSFVISFQESPGDVFDSIRDRIRTGKGRIRAAGPDYLAYSLIDAIVDNYFVILEKFGGNTDVLEEQLVDNPGPELFREIHRLKRENILLRGSIWPLREVVGTLTRSESELIADTTRIYLRDLYDHTIQVIDTVEGLRDVLSSMLDVYLSSLSNRMNEVMKVLTIIATVFIPLTFIAGIYGMNFQHMPELAWRWAYPAVLAVMAAVVVAMFVYFKRKEWL